MRKDKKIRTWLLIVAALLLLSAMSKARKAEQAQPSIRVESDAERQAKAYKAYQDYQYVKTMGPISGPMYRSTKW